MGIPSDDVTVTLSDGRVARLTKPDPARERRSDLFALQARLGRGGFFDPIELTKLRVILAIVELDGVPVAWPPVSPQRARVRAYIATFSQQDLDRLVLAYSKVYETSVVPLPPRGRVR